MWAVYLVSFMYSSVHHFGPLSLLVLLVVFANEVGLDWKKTNMFTETHNRFVVSPSSAALRDDSCSESLFSLRYVPAGVGWWSRSHPVAAGNPDCSVQVLQPGDHALLQETLWEWWNWRRWARPQSAHLQRGSLASACVTQYIRRNDLSSDDENTSKK